MKPILFNTEMVRAILDGRKTVTRRVLKPQPKLENGFWKIGGAAWGDNISSFHPLYGHTLYNRMPCHEDDILYVRETWNTIEGTVTPKRYIYKANFRGEITCWKPSIHMPKEAARIFLRVTGVKIERLQDIDGYGILAEGVDNGKSNPTMGKRWENMQRMVFSPLWNGTVKKSDLDKYGWDANPWVWVIEFERISKEEAYGTENRT